MKSIQKVSTYLIAIFNFLLGVIPLTSMAFWAFVDTPFIKKLISTGILSSSLSTPEGAIIFSNVQWTNSSKAIAFAGSIIGILPSFLSVFVLKKLFRNYQKGDIFTVANARYYKRLGLFFFLNALLIKPLSDMLMTLAVTCSNPPGHRYITLNFGTPNIEELFCGLIVIVISWVMLEACKLQDEQKFTI